MKGSVIIRTPHFCAQINRAHLSWVEQIRTVSAASGEQRTSTLEWRHLGDTQSVKFDVDAAQSDDDLTDYVTIALRIFESIILSNDDVFWTLTDDGWRTAYAPSATVISDIDEEFLGYGSLGR